MTNKQRDALIIAILAPAAAAAWAYFLLLHFVL